jgi:hypothetical protein
MACGLLLAGLAGLILPSARRQQDTDSEPEHAEMAIVAAGTVLVTKVSSKTGRSGQ